eukprot:m.159792 g.159792  ORF g.159792 m.159792 type:complete len:57 (-) comp14342_c0_seq26:3040-3210(-)
MRFLSLELKLPHLANTRYTCMSSASSAQLEQNMVNSDQESYVKVKFRVHHHGRMSI